MKGTMSESLADQIISGPIANSMLGILLTALVIALIVAARLYKSPAP